MQQSPLATGKKQRQKRRRIALRIIRPAELPVANPGSRENGRLALFLGRVGNAAVAVMSDHCERSPVWVRTTLSGYDGWTHAERVAAGQ